VYRSIKAGHYLEVIASQLSHLFVMLSMMQASRTNVLIDVSFPGTGVSSAVKQTGVVYHRTGLYQFLTLK